MNISYLPNSNYPTQIDFANITFNDSEEPINNDFKDVYFSDEGGFYESLYVFFKGNNLHNRLIEAKNNGCIEFNIGETGFGTGLNLLALMFILDKIKECINNSSDLNILDIMIPFQKRYYYTKEMKGSYSIKYVLPALFPDDPALNYGNLEGVHNGGEASSTFLAMQKMDKTEIETWRKHLLAYCKLDTFAMVKVFVKLQEVAE